LNTVTGVTAAGHVGEFFEMIITGVETVPLRIPFRTGNKSDASAWGDSNLPAADSLLVKVTTDRD
jgi:hypothetical protein